MIERQAVRDAPAAIVAAHEESASMPEAAHQLDHVARHRALAVRRVIGRGRRLGRVAVAAQIGHDERIACRQARRDPVPDRVRLRETVQQQQRRALPAAPKANVDAVDVTMFELETGKEQVPISAPLS